MIYRCTLDSHALQSTDTTISCKIEMLEIDSNQRVPI